MRVLALDGNSLVNRAFYGVRPLTTKDGRPTNAVYGFLQIFLKLMADVQPDRVVAAFDRKEPTFRHEKYPPYKAGRRAMPDELRAQMPLVKEALTLLGVAVCERAGFEADDILGAVARLSREAGAPCALATGDRDSLQLVGAPVTVLLASTKMGHAETIVYDAQAIEEQYHVPPPRMLDIKALMGDSSDNIPGVPGIGEKTAMALVERYGSLDAIYADLDALEVTPSVRQKLAAGKDSAYLSRELGEIRTHVPDIDTLDAFALKERDDPALAGFLTSLEQYKLLSRLGLTGVRPAAPPEEKPAGVIEVTGAPIREALESDAPLDFAYEFRDGRIARFVIHANGRLYRMAAGDAGFDDTLRALFAAGGRIRTRAEKPLFRAALDLGFPLERVGDDLSLSAYLLNPSSSDYSPHRLEQDYGALPPEFPDEPEDWRELCMEAAALPALCAKMGAQIARNGQEKLLREIELPLCRVLAMMEHIGFLVDVDGIRAFGVTLDGQITALTREIYDSVGYEFNLNSPKQLGEALFDKLGLPPGRKTKSGYSTDAETLERLRYDHPAVAGLLEYRQLSKLKSTYCDGMLKVAGPDGRIHSTFNQTETRTGRISSTEPNLQNIPVRSELGREMRRFFLAAPGHVLVDADYSQIELRVLAHIARDDAMVGAFKEGVDIHTLTASQAFGVPLELVTPLMRSRAKAVNFGIVYGISAFSLGKDIGVTRAEAEKYIQGYFATYPGVKAYMDHVVEKAKADGYVQTMFGRRRYLPELQQGNAATRAFGERVARNMPIQGAAADIIKIAMIRVSDRLAREKLAARLILQVHDELIVEAPEGERETVTRLLGEEMEAACALSAALKADVHAGRTWFEAKNGD